MPAANIDLYIDTAGAKSIIPGIIGMAKQNSRLVIIALYHMNVEINPLLLLGAEMNVYGSFAYGNPDIVEAISVMAAESTPIDKLITHRFPLDKLKEGLAVANSKEEVIKVVIDHEV